MLVRQENKILKKTPALQKFSRWNICEFATVVSVFENVFTFVYFYTYIYYFSLVRPRATDPCINNIHTFVLNINIRLFTRNIGLQHILSSVQFDVQINENPYNRSSDKVPKSVLHTTRMKHFEKTFDRVVQKIDVKKICLSFLSLSHSRSRFRIILE